MRAVSRFHTEFNLDQVRLQAVSSHGLTIGGIVGAWLSSCFNFRLGSELQ